ncbi:hypothetical protein I4U23_010375 [Adineta vaga]|nr:hypothetical protein I4U23_010375 [Adineta vaga]
MITRVFALRNSIAASSIYDPESTAPLNNNTGRPEQSCSLLSAIVGLVFVYCEMTLPSRDYHNIYRYRRSPKKCHNRKILREIAVVSV